MPEVLTTLEITITRVYNAPRDVVFKAWTDPDEIAKWWGPEDFGVSSVRIEAKPGGKCVIVMRGPDGVDSPMSGVFDEYVAPERLVMRSSVTNPAGDTLLKSINTITFTAIGRQTEITVVARADAYAPEAEMMLAGMKSGWNQSLQCLDDALTGAVERQIVVSRLVPTTPDKLFELFTDQTHLSKWWGPDGFTLTTHEVKVEPEGKWRFTMHGPDGVDYANLITYDEITPPNRLVYTHSAPDTQDSPFQTTVTFDEFMGQTALTMRAVFPTSAARDEVAEKYHALEGANQTVNRLIELVNSGVAV
jgi:uncharacterized protein YndB with AHSA1/START domain